MLPASVAGVELANMVFGCPSLRDLLTTAVQQVCLINSWTRPAPIQLNPKRPRYLLAHPHGGSPGKWIKILFFFSSFLRAVQVVLAGGTTTTKTVVAKKRSTSSVLSSSSVHPHGAASMEGMAGDVGNAGSSLDDESYVVQVYRGNGPNGSTFLFLS